MTKPRSAFVNTEIIRLHYLEWDSSLTAQTAPGEIGESAEDNIPLVLLHGLSATANTWQLVAQHLYHKHLVIAFDLRGHGLSEQPEAGYDLVTVAEDVVHGMAALGLGQVALVGHGWGARVALVLAARHPALVSHLVLVDCPHVEPRHWPGMTHDRFIRASEKGPDRHYASLNHFLEAMKAEMEVFWSPEIENIILSYVQQLPDGSVEERLQREHGRQIRESLWEDRALLYYSKLSCPVLLVPAAPEPKPDGDPPERLETAAEFAAAKGYMAAQVARAIRRCSVLWMPGANHDIQLQHPQTLAQAVASFVAEL
ncbi:pimeloyl-ACP methyl ester carboxylesterase [Thermosporothrix hazakensis]|uniref:Pimeloyl-ACP methyl ester carboxylesterase n=1 Tax=Thermosporothrix hazakensis TaxID=644383 RepID=A0A326U245_THEHA|nr:alpha/beta hydrolase [Thermosporothrix hazakensis]PZW24226.1 pimeloyl-ACP methyl ester carboxylesterase [Thermosporothrix hazakensis]GCE47857.1 hypothetical protein KTH_27260 [Thermosporothrix hazakensis]